MGGTLYARPSTNTRVPNVSGLMRSYSGSLHTKTAEVFLETFIGLTHVIGSIQCRDYRDNRITEKIEPLGETRIRKDYTIFFGTPKSDIGNSYFETKLCLGTVNVISTKTDAIVKEPIEFIVIIGLSMGVASAEFIKNSPETYFEIKSGKSFPPEELSLSMHPCMVDDYNTSYPHDKKFGLNLVSATDLTSISFKKFNSDTMRGMWIYSAKLSQVLSMQLDEMTKSIKRSEEEYCNALDSGELIIRH